MAANGITIDLTQGDSVPRTRSPSANAKMSTLKDKMNSKDPQHKVPSGRINISSTESGRNITSGPPKKASSVNTKSGLSPKAGNNASAGAAPKSPLKRPINGSPVDPLKRRKLAGDSFSYASPRSKVNSSLKASAKVQTGQKQPQPNFRRTSEEIDLVSPPPDKPSSKERKDSNSINLVSPSPPPEPSALREKLPSRGSEVLTSNMQSANRESTKADGGSESAVRHNKSSSQPLDSHKAAGAKSGRTGDLGKSASEGASSRSMSKSITARPVKSAHGVTSATGDSRREKTVPSSGPGENPAEVLEGAKGVLSGRAGASSPVPSKPQRKTFPMHRSHLSSGSEPVDSDVEKRNQGDDKDPGHASLRSIANREDKGGARLSTDSQQRGETPNEENHDMRNDGAPRSSERSIERFADGDARAQLENIRRRPEESSNSNLASTEDVEGIWADADSQLQAEALKSTLDAGANEVREQSAMPDSLAKDLTNSRVELHDLPLREGIEKTLSKYLDELKEDHEYWTNDTLRRSRPFPWLETTRQPRNPEPDQSSSFACLETPQLRDVVKCGTSATNPERVHGAETMSSNGRPASRKTFTLTPTTLPSSMGDLPGYDYFVNIKDNLLAPNKTHLHVWPYFDDDFDLREADDLKVLYNSDIQGRERKLTNLIQGENVEPYVEGVLEDLDCSWADVLRYFLEPDPDVGSDSDALEALQRREKSCKEEFTRASERWIRTLSTLPASTAERLSTVAIFCEAFQNFTGLSLWHVARRSDFAKLPDPDVVRPTSIHDNRMTCRICMRFNCPYHGEMKEKSEEAEVGESSSQTETIVATDLIHPPDVSARSHIGFPPSKFDTEKWTGDISIRHDRKTVKYWQNHSSISVPDERGPFYPCHHPGLSCEQNECSCFKDNLPCEKTCSCSKDCARKFAGCNCSIQKAKKGQMICLQDSRCACYQNGRECDPDLCGDCGACEAVNPAYPADEDLEHRCRNARIQRGETKHTLLGDSGVHGFGLYAGEDIGEHDFIGEYKGEIITKQEADRRGAVYEHQKLSYLFSLNTAQEIDSTHFGNEMRFINHAYEPKANVYPHIILVNTIHRIGLYANCKIKKGQELLFNYGPQFPDEQLGGKNTKKSAPHVRNHNLVRGFLDVREEEDNEGNLRAKGISKQSKGKGRARKQQGGALASASKGARKGAPESSSACKFQGQDAGERLAEFNISDDAPLDFGPSGVGTGGDDDNDVSFEAPEESDESSEQDSRRRRRQDGEW